MSVSNSESLAGVSPWRGDSLAGVSRGLDTGAWWVLESWPGRGCPVTLAA